MFRFGLNHPYRGLDATDFKGETDQPVTNTKNDDILK